jgi:hypothetical protein
MYHSQITRKAHIKVDGDTTIKGNKWDLYSVGGHRDRVWFAIGYFFWVATLKVFWVATSTGSRSPTLDLYRETATYLKHKIP